MDVVDRIYFIMTMYLTLTFGKFLYYIHLKKGFSNCDSKQSLIIINDIDLTFDFYLIDVGNCHYLRLNLSALFSLLC